MPAVESVGYEGRMIDEFVADLSRREVEAVVDVRLNAMSRRRGFGKTALTQALARAGIEYRHMPALGNPRSNRAAFGGADVETGRAMYRELLATPAGSAALAELAELAADRRVAIMCFEADEQHCHRWVVREMLHGYSSP